MIGYVLALSGAIGAGKTELAKSLADTLSADRVSFGDRVRAYAKQHGEDPTDRAILQRLGQALVVAQCETFVRDVLAQASERQLLGGTDAKLIVEGVRHIEVFLELKKQVVPRRVYLIHVTTPGSTREQRLMEKLNVERRVIARYDNDITEAQVARILPQYADLTIHGDLPVDLQVTQVVQKLKEWGFSVERELTAA